jgi:hypothetical protein
VSEDHARDNLLALERAEARRSRTPGVRRWFVVLPEPERDRLKTMRIPRLT